MKKPEEWKRIRSKETADCRIFRIREDFCVSSENSKEASFFTIECADWVNIIPITKQGEVVLIEQYRHGSKEITLEIPGGMIDEDEEPIECAKRELLEETGFQADKIIFLGRSRPNPAIQQNWIYHFVAEGCKHTGETKFDEHESIVSKLVSLSKIPKLIETEKINHSLVLA